MPLVFKSKEELRNLPPEELTEIAEIVNSEWISQIKATADLMHRRFNSKEIFIVGYHESKPVSVLETMLIRNHKPEIPEDAFYELLTGNGTFEWTEFSQGDYPLLVLVDITARKRFGRETLTHSLYYIAKETAIEHVWSYTPDISAVKKIHQNLGAVSVTRKILNARKKYTPSRAVGSPDNPHDVTPFDYTGVIRNRRIEMKLIAPPPAELYLDEKQVKALQYADLKLLGTEAAAAELNVSCAEYLKILETARRIVAEGIVYGQPILKK